MCTTPSAADVTLASPASAKEDVSLLTVRPPPGLAGDDDGPLPGSVQHGSGKCVPCFWRWKPQGCAYGADCNYCHSCPEGEVKARRKARVATLRTTEGPAQPQQRQVAPFAPPDVPPPPPPFGMRPAGMPSVGSALHGTGECRPCSWFHRPGGCQNGADCRHCHLCPDGEVKARKKSKAGRDRMDVQEREAPCSGATAVATTLPVLLGSAMRPAPTACPPKGPQPAPVISAGSALHGTGLCKPCAFLWKPSGCEKGQACQHCHLCPAGELQNRRKMKQAMLRQGSASQAERDPHAALEARRMQLALMEAAVARSERALQAQVKAVAASSLEQQEAAKPRRMRTMSTMSIPWSELSDLSELSELWEEGGCLSPPPGLELEA